MAYAGNVAYNQHVTKHEFIYQQANLDASQGMVQQGSQLPPPPKHSRGNYPVTAYGAQTNNGDEMRAPSNEGCSPTAPPAESPTTSPKHTANTHGGTIFANNSAEHPLRTVEKGWASFEDDNQGLISEEKKDWAHFTDHSKADTSSLTSSEAESTDDVWDITEEQREYYVNQFKTMQPDLNGIISGAVAKEFFEKSKLPVHELSRIWQLSDVNRDGALSLEEFCTAMHLVVLRRNDVELPEHLPPCLLPYVPLTNSDEPFAADLPPGSTLKRLTPTSPEPPSQQWGQSFPPIESPTSSSVSSPGTKPTPVNFEFKPINPADPDSKIVHPVALRMSPDGQQIAVDSSNRALDCQDANSVEQHSSGEVVTSPTSKQRGSFPTESLVELDTHPPMHLSTPLQGRPRPTPKKAHSIPSSQTELQAQSLLRPPPVNNAQEVGDRDGAPPPPPRAKGHSRSSSLDNTLIDQSDRGPSQLAAPPPAVPPRPSPKEAATLNNFPMTSSHSGDSADVGASQNATASDRFAMSKEADEGRDETDKTQPRTSKFQFKHGSLDRSELQATVRKHRENNTMLTRLNNELNQELQEVMEQRIALEIQLEHLRGPYSS